MKHLMRLSLPILLIVLLLNNSTPAYAQLGVTTRLMVGGNPLDAGADAPSISNDGRYIVFESASTNVVANDTNSVTDIFRYDTQTATYIRVSVSSAGVQGNGNSITPIISGNGRYVAFRSDANNLVVNDSNGYSDVFLRDMQMNTTTRISVNSTGNPLTGSGIIMPYDISSDGQYVLMVSNKPDIVPNDTNNSWDIFLYDRQTGTTSRASVNGNGDQLDLGAVDGNLSDNGRYLAFSSSSPNLVANDTNNAPDAFVKDLQTGQVTRISVNSGGNQATYPGSVNFPFLIVDDISADGRYVTFASNADNLVANDTNGDAWDQYFHDRQTGQTKRISINNDGTQADGISGNGVISDDGRYVFFESFATNLVANDTNNAIDVFMFDNQTNSLSRISLTSVGGQTDGDSGVAALSADMRYVVMASDATNIVANDTNNARDIFIYDRLVLSAPTLISPANGFTTTNPNITFSWNSVAGATEYQVQVAEDSNFTAIIEDVLVSATTHNTSPIYPSMYYWRVRAKNGSVIGAWSEARNFTIQLPAPTLIAPADNAFLTNLAVTFSWNSVPSADFYLIEIFTDNFFSYFDTTATTNYNYTLRWNDIYYWRVRTYDAYHGTFGSWSQTRSLATGVLSAPTLISPTNSQIVTDGNVTFNWDRVVGATEYEIQIANYPDGDVIDEQTITTTSYNYVFMDNETYQWKVRAKNGEYFSPWSIYTLTVQGLSAPILLSPTYNTLVSNPVVNFTWQPVAGATQYQIDIFQQYYNRVDVHNAIVNTTNYTFTLPDYGAYTWRVRAYGNAPNGYWSSYQGVSYDAIPHTSGYVYYRYPYPLSDYGSFFSANANTFFFRTSNNILTEYDGYGDVVRQITLPNNILSYHFIDISVNGRYLLLNSPLENLTPYGYHQEPYVYDTQTGILKRLVQSEIWVIGSKISDDGRYVILLTPKNLTPEDIDTTTPNLDLYLYDLQTDQIRLLSKNIATTLYGGANYGAFSGNNQYVAYIYSENISPGIPLDYWTGSLYLFNIQTGQVNPVNAPNGTNIIADYRLKFSDDGRYLLFASENSTLVPNDTNNMYDVFLYDLQTAQFTRVSLGASGEQLNNSSYVDTMSGDTQFTLFINAEQIWMYDRQRGVSQRISENVSGVIGNESSGSSDGRYESSILNNGQSIVFYSWARNLSPVKFFYRFDWFIKTRPPFTVPPSPMPYGVSATTNPNATFSWNWMFESNRYEIQIATDDAFTNIIHTDNYVHAMSYNYTLPSSGTYYWRVRGVNQLGAGAWSVNRLVLGIGANTLMDEQQLFNAMQPHLTNGLTFALFDVTANGILTTLQFSDGAVVTGTIKLVVQNGLLRITVEGISGGNGTQQATMRDTLPALIMTMLDESLPDGYLAIESVSMTTSAVNLGVVLPNP